MTAALGDYERQLRDVCFHSRASDAALARLGHDPKRWLTYRRIARYRLFETVSHAFGRLKAAIGEGEFGRLFDRFLAERPPRSVYLREVASELLEWLVEADVVPPRERDLARYEWAELATAYLPDGPLAIFGRKLVDFDMARPAALSAAHTLLALRHAVHREGDADTRGAPRFVCLYRDPKDHEVHTLELSSFAAALLGGIATIDAPLTELVNRIARDEDMPVDSAFVDSLGGLLADLLDRGLLLGSFA